MISRRIFVNLGVFVLLFCVLLYWAVTNVVKFDVIERPYRVTAYFSTSPGLRDGFEVAYLGLRVGTIGTVELISDPEFCTAGAEQTGGGGQADTGACVAVELKIDRGTELPANVTPFVRRKSAVGEPYVDLVPVPSSDTDHLEAGDHLTGGRIPLAYSDLFVAVNNLVQAVPEEALGTFFRELALGLDGRAEDIRTLVESAHDLTGTLASDPAFLDDLSTQLTNLTHTLAENRGNFGDAVDNLALLAESLAANRAIIAEFLDTSPAFVSQLTDLLDRVGGDLTCALRSLSIVATSLSQPTTLAQVDRLLDVAAEAGAALGGAVEQLPDGTWITGSFQFNVANDTPVVQYPEPLVLPAPPALGSCGVTLPAASGAGPGSGSGTGGTTSGAEGGSAAGDTDRPAAEPGATVDSTDRESEKANLLSGLLPYLIGLALLAALLGILRPWRWFGAGSDDTDEPAATPDTTVTPDTTGTTGAPGADDIEDALRS